jgi:hypothetical protein
MADESSRRYFFVAIDRATRWVFIRVFGLRKRAATCAHEFDTLCAALDIEHRLTPPKSPQDNGIPLVHLQGTTGQRVERFNGRIEEVL